MAAKPTAILIVSPDDFLLHQKAQEIVDAWVPEAERMFGLEVIDCSVDTIDQAVQAIRKVQSGLVQQGFFCVKKTVWMKDISFFDGKRFEKSETLSNALETFCEWLKESGIPEGVSFLATSTNVPKTTRFYKVFDGFSKQKVGQVIQLTPPSEKDAIERALKAAESMGYPMTREIATAFVGQVGPAPREMISELEKLLTYTKGKAPTVADIQAVCSTYFGGEFWDLTDAFGQHDLGRTLQILHNLFEKRIEVMLLLMQVEARLHELYLLCESLATRRLTQSGRWSTDLTTEEQSAVKALGVFDVPTKASWRLGRLIAQAQKWKPAELKRAIHVMVQAHEKMVSSGGDPKVLFEIALGQALQG